MRQQHEGYVSYSHGVIAPVLVAPESHPTLYTEIIEPSPHSIQRRHWICVLILRYETVVNGDQFPHTCRPLNIDARVKTFDFHPLSNGSFTLPAEIKP
jgi:hypothetical protein